MRESVVNEYLADSAAGGEGQDGGENGGVAGYESEGGGEFVGGRGGRERGGREKGGEEEVECREEGGEDVLGDHHLGAAVRAVGTENVVLGRVGEAIEEEVDA